MRILFVTLSNIGDVILTLPALDSLMVAFRQREVTVICGRRASDIFEGNPNIKRCIIYNQHRSILNRIKLVGELNKDRFNLVVDLKNSVLPLFLKAKYKTYPWDNAPSSIRHMRDRHLYKVKKFIQPSSPADGSTVKNALYFSEKDKADVSNLLETSAVSASDRLVIISPGARSHIKRWPSYKFANLADKLIQELNMKVIIVGDENDSGVCRETIQMMKNTAINLCARTTLKSLAALMERVELVISNDSAIMHLASYLNSSTLAIFGPTDEKKYGPWSLESEVVRSSISCRPCEVAQCKREDLKCMGDIEVDKVYAAAKKLL